MTNKALKSKDISNIPMLDGTNFGNASSTIINKWSRVSCEAINLITTRITERVFQEVVNTETIEKGNLLWEKIEDQYASKRAVDRGQVWMDWKRSFYNGNIQNYIDLCRELMMELKAVSIVVPPDLLLYSLLGKLGGDTNLHQFVENLALNKDIIEKPEKIFTQLQDLAHLNTMDCKKQATTPTAHISSREPHEIIYCCMKGKHNDKCSTHNKEYCWTENSHLTSPRREKKC
ncbi:hypothetical protein O181_050903 [Austropuccinia psidii MF-1]|uniref:Uncharacterized protein n=1 Tax=Austropuccinia psidii MF-1 TaxID=1389203 RepID=A0A9Q3DZY5_9BASI|nr:hypothetical protein [Austropuccinia psidii MF-1]